MSTVRFNADFALWWETSWIGNRFKDLPSYVKDGYAEIAAHAWRAGVNFGIKSVTPTDQRVLREAAVKLVAELQDWARSQEGRAEEAAEGSAVYGQLLFEKQEMLGMSSDTKALADALLAALGELSPSEHEALD